MADAGISKILELFGESTRKKVEWSTTIANQWCPFTNSKCFKIRKSEPDVSIGTCSLRYGREEKDIVICPKRLLERNRVFTDSLHLLTLHEPGNDLHVVSEMSIPGGSVDYFIVSTRDEKVVDFVGIEFQTLDTTGTVWPERQRFLHSLGIEVAEKDTSSSKTVGMNWKMTAKTILVQLHHKVETFEHIGKHFVLIIQDHLLNYLNDEFNFDHMNSARLGDAMHIHAYSLHEKGDVFRLSLSKRLSTDAAGVAKCLGLQANSKMELETIVMELQSRISDKTLFTISSIIESSDDMVME